MEKYNLITQGMDLQLFGDSESSESGAGEGSGDKTGNEGGGKNSPQGSEIELPKTQEELEKLLQSEADKRVTGALKTAQEKWEADYEAKLETEKAEAEKLAKLSQAEKEKVLMEKQKNELSQKEKEIALREMKLESIKILNEQKLPIDFADLLTADDADTTKSNIDTFSKAFKDAVSTAVDERLKSGTIPKGGVGNIDVLNKKLEDARKKAKQSGKLSDRAEYAKIKREIEKTKK
jgi:hypothetical protein